MSPPPPPPLIAGAYDAIVEDDPEGFFDVRRNLENWFPKLSHVATSSMGAYVGEYIPDFVVTPQQLTSAFLSTVGMEGDSLGARVVQSKHTGRWRYACKKMHEYFAETTSPGAFSAAFAAGTEEQATAHTGKWDRNPFLAAMLEIQLSMAGHPLDNAAADPHTLWSRICGGEPNRMTKQNEFAGGGPAGHRVPTREAYDPEFATYGFQAAEDVPITDFAPLIAYGSLETLRSQRMLLMYDCPEGFAPEDALAAQFCQKREETGAGEDSGLGKAMETRAGRAPFAIQRNVWCDPHRSVSIEQTVGNPLRFEDPLLDVEMKTRFDVDNPLTVPADARGEEKLNLDWTMRSLRGWVYVTSSADAFVRAGMYRLADLPLFRAESCNALPATQCSDASDFTERDPAFKSNPFGPFPNVPYYVPRYDPNTDIGTEHQDLPPFVRDLVSKAVRSGASPDQFPQGLQSFAETVPQYSNMQGYDERQAFIEGRRLLSTKMSEAEYFKALGNSVEGNTKRKRPVEKTYRGSLVNNLQGRQELTYARVYLNRERKFADGLNGASHWRTGKEAVLAHRCSRLVTSYLDTDPCNHAPYAAHSGCSTEDLVLLSQPEGSEYGPSHWLFRFDPTPSPSPPPPPPVPFPPPSPPSPCAPPSPPVLETQAIVMGYVRDAEEEACTTVYFLSQTTRCERLALALTKSYLFEFTSPPTPPPIGDGTSPSPPPVPPPSPSMPADFALLAPTRVLPSTQRYPLAPPGGTDVDPYGYYWGGTQPDLLSELANRALGTLACVPGAPLACATGYLEAQCFSGMRRCGTEEENAQDPFLDFEFTLTHDSYLWGIRFNLPHSEQLAGLFVGTKRLELFGPRNTPLECHGGGEAVTAVPTDYRVTVLCAAPAATDDELRALATAWRARLTLTGSFRQAWLALESGIEIIERPLQAAEVEVLALPPSPAQPPPPPAQGIAQCSMFMPNRWIPEANITRREHEPCGLDQPTCCAHRIENGAAAYELDDAGCCTLLYLKDGVSAQFVNDTTRHNGWSLRAGTGI